MDAYEDKEKGSPSPVLRPDVDSDVDPSQAIVARFGALGPFIANLFEIGIEARGVERVPEDQRDDKFAWNK